jgi:hypothetical protein
MKLHVSRLKKLNISIRRQPEILVISIWCLFWRYFGINSESLHVDEHVQAVGISPSLMETWAHSKYLGMPPVEMTLHWIAVTFFGNSNSTVRIVPIILGTLSCIIFALTIGNLSNRLYGFLAGITAGVIPQFIFTQQTARPYALYIFILGLVFFFASRPITNSFKPLIASLTILPWTRSLEGPISASFLSIIFLFIFFTRKPQSKFEKKLMFAFPALSVILSLYWTSSTRVTILGSPGDSVNPLGEILIRVKNIPELYLSDAIFMFGRSFVILVTLSTLSIFVLSAKKIRSIELSHFLKRNENNNFTFGLIVFIYCTNSLLIFIAVNALTKLPHADRYFTLGMLGPVSLLLYSLFKLNLRLNTKLQGITTVLLILILGQYVLGSFYQGTRIDKTQYDQINLRLSAFPAVEQVATLAYLPGSLNQYIPGWPSSLGLENSKPPIWVTFLLYDLYKDENFNLKTPVDLRNIVLLPSVDERGSLLIGNGWDKQIFISRLGGDKLEFIDGGAIILRNLSKLEFLAALATISKSRFGNSESAFWIDALALTLSKYWDIDVESATANRFCSRLSSGVQIDSGNSFGNWGSGGINAAEFFSDIRIRNCE